MVIVQLIIFYWSLQSDCLVFQTNYNISLFAKEKFVQSKQAIIFKHCFCVPLKQSISDRWPYVIVACLLNAFIPTSITAVLKVYITEV